MPVSAPPAQQPTDRAALLLRTRRVDRGTHRCLAVHGHVDDLLLTPDGRALRLAELLAVDGVGDGIMTVVASELSGAATLTPPGTPLPEDPVTLPAASMAELLEQALERMAGRRSTLLLQGACSAVEQDELLAERLRNLPFDQRLADGAAQVVVSFRDDAPAALQGATGWETFCVSLPDKAERRSALGYWAHIRAFDPASIDLDDLAATTGGLELDDLRRLVQEHARVEPVTPRRVSEIRERRSPGNSGTYCRSTTVRRSRSATWSAATRSRQPYGRRGERAVSRRSRWPGLRAWARRCSGRPPRTNSASQSCTRMAG